MKLQQAPNFKLNVNLNNQAQVNRKNSGSEVPVPQTTGTQPAFKGMIDGGLFTVLNFLQTNQGVGAAIVDLFSMVIPRTIVDFTRSPEAGTETMRRECSNAVNDALVGGYGILAATLLSTLFNKKFSDNNSKIKANKMFVSDDMIEVLAKQWEKHHKTDKPVYNYIKGTIEEGSIFKPEALDADKNKGFVKLTSIQDLPVDEVANKLDAAIQTGGDLDANTHKYLKALIADKTGITDKFKFEIKELDKNGKEILDKDGNEIVKAVETSLDDLIKNIYKLGKSFKADKVTTEFAKPIAENGFVSGLKKLNSKVALFGVGICVAIGASIQPINRYLTKKKTGKDGFVGGGENDKSNGFKAMKAIVGAAFGTGALLTIIGNPTKIGGPVKIFKKLIEKIQFKGLAPTIEQFKLIYGATIVSRLLVARNKEELTESSFKDTLGFLNWLILGGFISKLSALGLEKLGFGTLVKYNKEECGSPKFIKGIMHSYEEVMHEGIKNTIKADGKAMNIFEMIQKASQIVKEAKQSGVMTKAAEDAAKALKKTKGLAIAQVAGYLYSGIVLGVALPKLNIAINKAFQKHKKQAQASNSNANASATVAPSTPQVNFQNSNLLAAATIK